MKRKLKAYVIGPYRDERGMWYVGGNIQRARHVAIELWRRGYAVFCPHSNSSFMDGGAEDKDFLDGDLEWMVSADVAFVVPKVSGMRNWDESIGSVKEIEECLILDIPVIYLHYNKADGAILIPREWEDGERDMEIDGITGTGDDHAGLRVVGDISDVQFRYDPDSANNPPAEPDGVPARIMRICEKWDERGSDPGKAG